MSMFSCRLFLFWVVIVLCMYLSAGSSLTKKCGETDKQALLKLKDGFIRGSHILSSWKGGDCCKWEGVSCNNLTGHVTSLELLFGDPVSATGPEDLNNYFNPSSIEFNITGGLGGKIDSSICELQHLSSLDLSTNDLEGEIPKCIGSLGQLIELNLSWNRLVGSIPHTFANLSYLQILNLELNNLVVNDLEWVSHLSNLRYLILSYNDLSRAIDWPSSISRIPSLWGLNLVCCELPQVSPKSILHMNTSTSLKVLDLGGNELNSSILPWVLNISKVLTSRDLPSNSLHSAPYGFANTLKYLDLSYNKLGGSVTQSFETLRQLKDLSFLSLEHNPFSSGPLPNFSELSSLNVLFLQNTSIVGPLVFDHLPHHLQFLDLTFNSLSGSIPEFEVSKFASLSFLGLSHNQLSGTLPYSIGQLPNLESLYLSSNNMNGIISETHLLNLSGLQALDVSGNSFHFILNHNWVPPFQLDVLWASSCMLGPQFPTWLKYQRNLLVLDISNTSIIDSFPKWLWDISSNLSNFNVSYNKLSGVLPKSLPNTNPEYATVWDFSFNNLSGPVPPFPQNLDNLFLSNNMLSGFVSFFCTTSPKNLSYLDLSSNLLAGPLPNCWEKFQSLKVLNLADNRLSGRIPKSFGTLRKIESMLLYKNNFSGEIPSLTLCRSLKFIDLGENILDGALPAWIGHNLHRLVVLSLSNNKIQGSIRVSVCNLIFLQVLDLSSNNITGEIPHCLGHVTALSNIKFQRQTVFHLPSLYFYSDFTRRKYFVDEMTLVWKGQTRKYGKILGFMTIIDLSSNQLSGEIPESITTLMALAGLNLSGNHLTGLIPSNIGHMQRLESLDLSRNHLYGGIPAGFSNLTFLSVMNLSFNNLSGEIPVSPQLQTLDASTYVGNIGLCGPPLTNQCPWNLIPSSGRVDKNGIDEDEDEIINFGFYISLGLGFCVGFWGVCGTLTIKSSWRHAYFQFCSKIYDWIYVTVVVFVARLKRRFQIQDY